MKTIGVLGGLGPQATMDFEARVHRVSQDLIPPKLNHGYPPMVVLFLRHAPILITESGAPQLPIRPDPRLFEAAKHLGQLADFLVITSNGVHKFQREIEQASGRKVVSMIDAVIAEVQRRRCKRVGALALGEPTIYTQPLEQLGIPCETITPDLRNQLDAAIFRVMEGRNDANDQALAHHIIADLRARNVDPIIPGCTEIPFLLGEMMNDPDILNPLELLAHAAVTAAIASD